MTWHKERQIVVNNVNLWRHTDKQSRMSDFHTKDYAFYFARDKLLTPYLSIFHFISFRAISLEYNTLMYVHKKALTYMKLYIFFYNDFLHWIYRYRFIFLESLINHT